MRKLKIFEHISLDGVIEVRGSAENARKLCPQASLSMPTSSLGL